MKEINASNLMMQMKILEAKASGNSIGQVGQIGDQVNASNFNNALVNALKDVNQFQLDSGEMVKRFEMGDKSVSLAEVMISMQKANISFQAVTQVRNRLVTAYQDIMNMPM